MPSTDPLKEFMENRFEGDIAEYVRKLAKKFLSADLAVDELVRAKLLEMIQISQRHEYKDKSLREIIIGLCQINCEDVFAQPSVFAMKKL